MSDRVACHCGLKTVQGCSASLFAVILLAGSANRGSTTGIDISKPLTLVGLAGNVTLENRRSPGTITIMMIGVIDDE